MVIIDHDEKVDRPRSLAPHLFGATVVLFDSQIVAIIRSIPQRG